MNNELTQELTPEQLAYEKAEAVINSCTLCGHFENAVLFLDLFNKQFSNQESTNKLFELMKSKKEELNCY